MANNCREPPQEDHKSVIDTYPALTKLRRQRRDLSVLSSYLKTRPNVDLVSTLREMSRRRRLTPRGSRHTPLDVEACLKIMDNSKPIESPVQDSPTETASLIERLRKIRKKSGKNKPPYMSDWHMMPPPLPVETCPDTALFGLEKELKDGGRRPQIFRKPVVRSAPSDDEEEEEEEQREVLHTEESDSCSEYLESVSGRMWEESDQDEPDDIDDEDYLPDAEDSDSDRLW